MMNMLKVSALVFALLLGAVSCTTQEEIKTAAEIKQIIIKESIAQYPDRCPCPYSVDRAGRRCSKRSAYSRPSGASLLCYASDISDDMVKGY